MNILGRVVGALKGKTGEDVNGGVFLLLIDHDARRIFLEDMVGEILGITDSTRDRGGGNALFGANDARDLQCFAVFADEIGKVKRGVFTLICPHGLIAVRGRIGARGLGEKLRGRQEHKFGVQQLLKGVRNVRGRVIALHQSLQLLFNAFGVKDTEHVERHFADLIVAADNEYYLVVALRPAACDHVVLLVEQVLVVDHLGKDVHAAHAAAHFHEFRHAREGAAHMVKHHVHADLTCFKQGFAVLVNSDHVEDLQIEIVGILNVVDKTVDLVGVFLNVFFKGFKVVADRGAHCRHHRAERVIYVNFSGVLVVGGVAR